jgi:hypothetical protein
MTESSSSSIVMGLPADAPPSEADAAPFSKKPRRARTLRSERPFTLTSICRKPSLP